MFLKEKRDGTIKGINLTDGCIQRNTIKKEEAATPKEKLLSVFITSVIDAHEKRDAKTVDIPNAFIIFSEKIYFVANFFICINQFCKYHIKIIMTRIFIQ